MTAVEMYDRSHNTYVTMLLARISSKTGNGTSHQINYF